MNPEKHPAACLICGDTLPPRDEPRGRPRFYCDARCRDRARDLAEIERWADEWAKRGHPERADVLRERAAAKRRAWKVA